MGQIVRAFDVFRDYEELFGFAHSIHSYNALLFAVAKSKAPNVESMLTVMQEMEV
jgi:hypothetical protein